VVHAAPTPGRRRRLDQSLSRPPVLQLDEGEALQQPPWLLQPPWTWPRGQDSLTSPLADAAGHGPPRPAGPVPQFARSSARAVNLVGNGALICGRVPSGSGLPLPTRRGLVLWARPALVHPNRRRLRLPRRLWRGATGDLVSAWFAGVARACGLWQNGDGAEVVAQPSGSHASCARPRGAPTQHGTTGAMTARATAVTRGFRGNRGGRSI